MLEIKQLEKGGWLKRVSVESDARLKKLVLTEKGELVTQKIGEGIDKFEQELFALLGNQGEEFDQLLDQLIQQCSILENDEKEGKTWYEN